MDVDTDTPLDFEDGHKVKAKLRSPPTTTFDDSEIIPNERHQLILINTTLENTNSTVEWIQKNSKAIESSLIQYGSILFRGFPITTHEHFGSFVSCFPRWIEHRYEDALTTAVRKQISPRVYSLQGQTNSSLIFHHEQAYLQQFPTKIFFYCQHPATVGGQTGISFSAQLVEKMLVKYPEFMAKLEDEGVKYFANMLPIDRPEISRRSWQNTLGTQSKEEAEKILTEFGYTYEWIEKNGMEILRACSDIRPAILKSPSSGERIWFNTTVKHWMNGIVNFMNRHGRRPTPDELKTEDMFVFGDGGWLDPEILEYTNDLIENQSFNINWEAGDVVLIDNMQMLHCRRDGTEGRKLFGSFIA